MEDNFFSDMDRANDARRLAGCNHKAVTWVTDLKVTEVEQQSPGSQFLRVTVKCVQCDLTGLVLLSLTKALNKNKNNILWQGN